MATSQRYSYRPFRGRTAIFREIMKFNELRSGTAATDLIAKVVMMAGLLGVVLAVLQYKLFELDRFFVAKELVLHLVALVVAATLLAHPREIELDFADRLLIAFLALSGVSALFATNHWLAQRALAISMSSAAIFWGARRVAAVSGPRALLISAGIATVLAAVTALAQAYGLETEAFSTLRAPGGTFGNRNFVAHFVAIGLPVVIWCMLTARSTIVSMIWAGCIALIAISLILSRSRAAWLAVLACAFIMLIGVMGGRRYWDRSVMGTRLTIVLVAVVVGGGAAMALPNTLAWNSESPYLDSAKGIVDYSRGSGRGRMDQYRNTLRMAVHHPVLGVGPGNWPVTYVKFAPTGDRSLTDDGMTANPWPSSDWLAYISERGFLAAAALFALMCTLFLRSLRRWRLLGDRDAVLGRLALAGTLASAMVVSMFDAVLLLAGPALLLWSVAGALAGPREGGRGLSLSKRALNFAGGGMLMLLLAGSARSAAQIGAMALVGREGNGSGWTRAARLDPGDYRINLKAAQTYASRGRCGNAVVFARRANGLFPEAQAARWVLRQCGE
jgi:O-antigen ligase